ncbi:MAG: hypothetical protein IPK50_18160 [Fibrobacterota bacterium]|nr:MAG: hypothetical protein IPK50_18160 [Fibrobacterota bacterium]
MENAVGQGTCSALAATEIAEFFGELADREIRLDTSLRAQGLFQRTIEASRKCQVNDRQSMNLFAQILIKECQAWHAKGDLPGEEDCVVGLRLQVDAMSRQKGLVTDQLRADLAERWIDYLRKLAKTPVLNGKIFPIAYEDMDDLNSLVVGLPASEQRRDQLLLGLAELFETRRILTVQYASGMMPGKDPSEEMEWCARGADVLSQVSDQGYNPSNRDEEIWGLLVRWMALSLAYGELDSAKTAIHKFENIARRTSKSHADFEMRTESVTDGLGFLAKAYQDSGRLADAEACILRQEPYLSALEKTPAQVDRFVKWIISINDLGQKYLDRREASQGIRLLEKAMRASQARLAKDSTDAQVWENHLTLENNLGLAYLESRDTTHALETFRNLETGSAGFAKLHPENMEVSSILAFACEQIGDLVMSKNDRSTARIEYAKGLAAIELVVRADHSDKEARAQAKRLKSKIASVKN